MRFFLATVSAAVVVVVWLFSMGMWAPGSAERSKDTLGEIDEAPDVGHHNGSYRRPSLGSCNRRVFLNSGEIMKNVVYAKTIIPTSKSVDGETPTVIQVTQEVNFWALSRTGPDGLQIFAVDPYCPYKLIEQAVDYGRERGVLGEDQ